MRGGSAAGAPRQRSHPALDFAVPKVDIPRPEEDHMPRITRSTTQKPEHLTPKTPTTAAPPTAKPAPAAARRSDAFAAGAARPMTTLSAPEGAPLATPRVKPAWLGNTAVNISREPSERPRASETFSFDTWARQRAGKTTFNFEVWAPGTTDRHNPDLWRDLDVQVHYRYAGQTDWKKDHVNNDGRSGNNAHYALDLRRYDPWSSQGVSTGRPNPSIPVSEEKNAEGRVVAHRAKLEFFFTVNGSELRAPSGKPFEGTYENY